MTNHDWYLETSGQLAGDINNHFMPSFMALVQDMELQGADVGVAQTAVSEAPNPLTPEVYLERAPYQDRANILTQFSGAVERGILEPAGDEAYLLTEKGQTIAEKIPATAVTTAKTMHPISEKETERLAALLKQVVDASLAANEPAHPNLARSRFYDPGAAAPVIERLRRYLNDLNAFRDDAHIAAWRVYDLEGYEWEAFSHIWGENVWGDEVATAVEVAEKLAFRGYDEAEYKAALQDCCERGLLTESAAGKYQLTEKGTELRQEAEDATDNYFYGPWSALFVPELIELNDLLGELQSSLKEK